MRAWVVRAPDVPTFSAFEVQGYVAIRGGPPDLAVTDDLTGADTATIEEAVARRGLPANHAARLTEFVVTAAPGDAVVTPEPGRKPGRDILVGRLAGPYEHHDPPRTADLWHARPVDWEERLPRVMLPSSFWQGRVAAVTEAPLDEVAELLGL